MNIGDVARMAEKIRDHRFDGYTDTGIADEIEKFSSGNGIGSISTAVEALKSVAGALAETDATLRRELSKLGVEWQSQAGGQAGAVFSEKAGFSRDAEDKVGHAAEMIFAQGEAFNHTLYKLPDADTVRKGAGGLTLGDTVMSLIGFETDHVRDVMAAKNARAQAVEALNGYAKQSGENLSSIESLSQPQGLLLDSTGAVPKAVDLAGSAVDLGPGATGPTAGTKAAHVAAPAKGTGAHAHPPKKPPVVVPDDPPTSPVGVPAPGGCAPRPAPEVTAPSSTAPTAPTAPAATVPAAPHGGAAVVGGPPQAPAERPETGHSPASAPLTAGSSRAPSNPRSPGSSVSDVLEGATSSSLGSAASGGGLPGGVAGGSGAGSGFAGGTSDGAQALGKGRLSGVGPQAPTIPGEVGQGFSAVSKPGPSAGDLGAGAAALGAGGIGGAMSGEPERQGRGFARGRSAERPAAQPAFDELPEEEAVVVANSERLNPPARRDEAGFMESAAPRRPAPEEEGVQQVRRFGIDDEDMGTDQRRVSPDLIDDAGADETR